MSLKCLLYITLFSKVCLSTYTSVYPSPNLSNDTDTNEVWVPRVINGYPAKLGDVPYQVSMKALLSRARGLYVTFCGATIIGDAKMLTAAHCFEEKGASSCRKLLYPGKASKNTLRNKYAVAGNLINYAKYTPDGPEGQWRTLRSVLYPKSYKFPTHDIAVAFSHRAFNYTSNISPIPMASRNTDYHGKCLVSGFGRIGHGPKDQSEILLLAHLEIVPKMRCSQVHRKRMDRFVCTSSMVTDVGKGDSGGPLVCANTGDPRDKGKGVLVGVVSGHARGRGSFFTRVSSYQSFISKAISVSMYKYNIKTCTAFTITIIYKTFLFF